MFVGHKARGGRGPGLGTDPKEAPGPPLDGVGLHSDSNGYGSGIEEGVCSEHRRGAKKPHHCLQVHITTPPTCRAEVEALPMHAGHFIFPPFRPLQMIFFYLTVMFSELMQRNKGSK